MKNRNTFLLLVMLLIPGLFGQALAGGGFKKYAGEFMYLGAGARGTSLGGAYGALVNDASASYWNPAALSEVKGFQLQFMNSKQFISSIQTNYLAVSHPYDDGAVIGLSLYFLTVNNIQNTASAGVFDQTTLELVGLDESKIRSFNTGDYILSASYSRRWNEQLSWGATLKMLYRDFDFTTAAGMGLDIGLLYRVRGLRLSAVARDITGTLIAWNSGEKQWVSPTIGLGAAWPLVLESLSLTFSPTVGAQFMGEGRDFAAQTSVGPFSADFMAGLEINYNDVISIRAGMDALQRLNAGIGLKLPHISFDYAFTAYANELGNIHRINFNLAIDPLF